MVAALKVPVLRWDAERVAQPPTDTDPAPPRLQSPGTPHCPPDPAWWSDSTRQSLASSDLSAKFVSPPPRYVTLGNLLHLPGCFSSSI